MRVKCAIIVAAVLMLVSGLTGYWAGHRANTAPQIITEARVDTLYIRDTITRETPVFTRVYVRDTIRVAVCDTLYIELPREVKVYEDSLYRAEVSGYEPSLDRIDIYQQERVITRDITQVVKVKRNARWGVGVQVGYGIGLHSGAVYAAPYVGVGVSYNILTF